MLGMTRWNSTDDFFTFQRQLESVFDQFWNELPSRTAAGHSPWFQVTTTNDTGAARYEQSFAVPQFLDLEKISASYRHGMLQLMLSSKESVKPRRIHIEGVTDQRQISSAA